MCVIGFDVATSLAAGLDLVRIGLHTGDVLSVSVCV